MLRLPARWGPLRFVVGLCLFLGCRSGQERTALDEYVAAADPAMATIGQHDQGDGVTTYILEMTSQTWLTTRK